MIPINSWEKVLPLNWYQLIPGKKFLTGTSYSINMAHLQAKTNGEFAIKTCFTSNCWKCSIIINCHLLSSKDLANLLSTCRYECDTKFWLNFKVCRIESNFRSSVLPHLQRIESVICNWIWKKLCANIRTAFAVGKEPIFNPLCSLLVLFSMALSISNLM